MPTSGDILCSDYGDELACSVDNSRLYCVSPADTLPVAPTFSKKPLHGRAQVNAAYGKLYVADGKIVKVGMPDGKMLTGAVWENRFMVSARTLPLIGHAYINRDIEEPLRWLLRAWEVGPAIVGRVERAGADRTHPGDSVMLRVFE